MARTNIDIDDDACAVVMARYRLATKRQAVNLSLNTPPATPLDLDRPRSPRGSGWAGHLHGLRASRAP